MADDMTPCGPPCDECGCCCEAMLPTTLNAIVVTLEPVSIAYKLPETIELPPGPDSDPFAHLLWKELEKHREEMLNKIMDQMTLPPHLIGEVKPGHP